jgi:hypothetical protein
VIISPACGLRKAGRLPLSIMAAADIPPMTMQEIQAEVDAVRKARRARSAW